MKTFRPLLFLAILALPSFLAAQTPVGGAIEVGMASAVSQRPDVEMNLLGDFVVGWARTRSSDLPPGVFGRLYAADGSPRTREIQIDRRADPEFGVRLAMMDDGSFVAVYRAGGSLVAQRFTSKGTPLGGNVTVARGDLFASEAGSQGDGGFVVVWQGTSLSARVFGADGQPLGPEIPVAVASSYPPRLAVGPDGSFLVVWLQSEPPSGYFVEGRLFEADGTPRGERFLISDRISEGLVGTYDTAADGDGDFLVTWFDPGRPPLPPSAFVRRYAPDGSPLGGPSLAGHRPAGKEIAAGPGDSFVSIWQAVPAPGGGGVNVVVRRFAADGAPLGSLVVLNPKPYSTYPSPVLAGNGTGSFAAAWFGKLRSRRSYPLLVQRFRTE
ncbi:MAG TPA: hypothetical protein VHC97_22800 [Thermoanaerobaculia bacterium]|jgi:hypothetical protein|nr:hypothetical protein [Thermoanaerobaculia bacterium]